MFCVTQRKWWVLESANLFADSGTITHLLVLPVSGSRPLGSSSCRWGPHMPPRSCGTGDQVTPPVAPPGSSVAGPRASSLQSPVSRIWLLYWWTYKRIVGLPLTSLIDWYIKFSYSQILYSITASLQFVLYTVEGTGIVNIY